MAELGLHLKYRPAQLEDMLGNKETIGALRAVVEREAGPPHALLFSGPRGCGKTTLARIFATMVGCDPTSFHEVNAADMRGIENIREIRQQSQYRPMRGKCCVWLLDEAHMLTREAQTALLKLAEDTPPHVYLVLATTEPQKVIPTLRDRCMIFPVRPLSQEELEQLLAEVAHAEKITIDTEVVARICRDALGSPRAALVVLDKVKDLPAEEQAAAAERQAAIENTTIELCRALVKGTPWRAVAGILKGLTEEEPESVRRAVLGYCGAVLTSGQPRAYAIMTCFEKNYFDTGRAGLQMSCYEATGGK